MNTDNHMQYKNHTFNVEYVPDDCAGPPWKENDGHGPVSDWTRNAKKAGEWILHTDRHGSKRLYDFSEAMRIAKRDGWDAKPYGVGSRGEKALRAVQADFKYLRGYLNDHWNYVGVVVTLLDDEGDPAGYEESLWCVEHNYSSTSYAHDIARELADEILHQLEKAEMKERVARRFSDDMANAL